MGSRSCPHSERESQEHQIGDDTAANEEPIDPSTQHNFPKSSAGVVRLDGKTDGEPSSLATHWKAGPVPPFSTKKWEPIELEKTYAPPPPNDTPKGPTLV